MRLRLLSPFVLVAVLLAAVAPAAGQVDEFDDDFGVPKNTDTTPPDAEGPAAPPEPVESPPTTGAPPAPAPEPLTPESAPPEHPATPEAAPTASGPDARAYAASAFGRVGGAYNSLQGLVGGVHAIDGGSAAPGTFRLALYGSVFAKNGFITDGDHERHAEALLSGSITPIEHLELAALLSTSMNRSRGGDPELIQVIGDMSFFAKGYASPRPWVALSGDLELALLSGVGSIGVQGNATSVGLRASATFDLRRIERRLPLLVRGNFRYYFDNSAKLVRDVEDARYRSLTNPTLRENEFRHLVTPAERFALQINRTDSVGMVFGVEAPLRVGKRGMLSPLLEWGFALPANRQDYDCLEGNAPDDPDGCLAREGFSARPSTLTLGVRAEPAVRGLGLLVAVDIATSGSDNFVRELAPNAAWALLFGVAYAYDPYPPPVPHPTPLRVEVPVVQQEGHVLGSVVDAETEQPIARAFVHFEDSDLSDIVSDPQGTFVSYPLAPGPHGLRVSAEGYQEALCVATLPAEAAEVPLRCALRPLPRLGSVHGRVIGASGEAIRGAVVKVQGPDARSLQTDASGMFAAGDMAAGKYSAQVEAEGYLTAVTAFEVVPRAESTPSVVLTKKPDKPLTELKAKSIAIKRQVKFLANSAEISGESHALLAEVADVLLRNPQLLRVEVQGHTDDRGSAVHNSELSQARAEAVRSYLIGLGVSPGRLSAMGYGPSRPLAPNITPGNRARNRRVEFVILEVSGQ